MWRLFAVSTLLLTLAFGTAADGKCRTCVESITADRSGAGATTLMVQVLNDEGASLPASATAVVMKVDGENARLKCATVGLIRTSGPDPLRSVYTGSLGSYASGSSEISGRLDIAGDIYDFRVPLDGTPGPIQMITAAVARESQPGSNVVQPVPLRAAAPASLPEPAAAPATAETAGAAAVDLGVPALLGLAVIAVTIAGAYFDRRRALARGTST